MLHGGVTRGHGQWEEYIKLAKPNKHRTELTPANILSKAHMFDRVHAKKLRGVRAPEFEKVVSMMLASRKYIMSHQRAYPQQNVDMRYTALVWKNLTAVERFNGEDLGVLPFIREL